MFGLGPEDEDVIKIEVHRGERWTLEPERMERMFDQAGWEPPKATQFVFCKFRFKPIADLASVNGWSSASDLETQRRIIVKRHVSGNQYTSLIDARCLLDLERCFGAFWTRGESASSEDMFKRLTFQYPECGDCCTSVLYRTMRALPCLVIMALVTASGPLGLSAFFPPRHTIFTTPSLPPGKQYPKYLPPPHLPLTATWHEANFSLQSVMSTTALPNEAVDLRSYTMRLLSRYLYMSGA